MYLPLMQMPTTFEHTKNLPTTYLFNREKTRTCYQHVSLTHAMSVLAGTGLAQAAEAAPRIGKRKNIKHGETQLSKTSEE